MTKKQELVQERKRNDRLLKMIAEERQKVAGHEQIAKVHSAYIAILLQRLGAVSGDNAISISRAEVKEIMEKCETRALINTDDNSYKLYCEIIE